MRLIALLLGLVVGTSGACQAAAILTQSIDPPQTNVGDPVIVTLTVQNGSLGGIQLPPVDGLRVNGTNLQIKSIEEKDHYYTTVSMNFSVTPTRSGDLTIPSFEIRTQEGELLHVKAMKLHVLGNVDAPATNSGAADMATPPPSPANPPAVLNSPVVMPSTTPPPDNAGPTPSPDASYPRETDGTPAKVFLIIHTLTNQAFVGQSIPLQIDFYIRTDVNANQNSLPTIKGSDFLMNNFTVRGHETLGMLEGEQYERETWITAISAPKSGDFPLRMQRDTYWVKSITNNNLDPFSGNQQPDLAHEPIDSNQMTMHVQPLPETGRPDHFTGAIGQYKITANAQPASVAVGEPVTIRFVVSGEGNFDYVRCPVLADDPAWKTYTPTASTNYFDESRTHAVKTFDQAVIPQKNGNLQLPPATFSYFDPSTKQYVTVPISLPTITVTGTAIPTPTADAAADTNASVASTVQPDKFLPNRLDPGLPQSSLRPVYRQVWFWVVQAGLIALPILAALLLFLRVRSAPNDALLERASRQRSLRQEEDAMGEAARRKDAVAFFIAARHAVRLQLGARWNLTPEALTLGEIRQRDPELGATLEPLFRQADEVIYSGHATPTIDLTEWDRRVRTELLQLQTA
jgi:hypothetical protein